MFPHLGLLPRWYSDCRCKKSSCDHNHFIFTATPSGWWWWSASPVVWLLTRFEPLDGNGLIRRNLVDAPIKDTVAIPDGGYTIIRFTATNPGRNVRLFHYLWSDILYCAIQATGCSIVTWSSTWKSEWDSFSKLADTKNSRPFQKVSRLVEIGFFEGKVKLRFRNYS